MNNKYLLLLVVVIISAGIVYELIKTKKIKIPVLGSIGQLSPPGVDPNAWNQCLSEDDNNNFSGQSLDQIKFICSSNDNKRYFCDSNFFPEKSCAKVCQAVLPNFVC